MTDTTPAGPTISEATRANLPVGLLLTCTCSIVAVTLGLGAAWWSMDSRVSRIQAIMERMSVELNRIGDRVDGHPTRREFDEVLTRLRALESRRE